MSKITIILHIIIILILSCKGTEKSISTPTQQKESLEFPDDYAGYWGGNLNIFKNNKIQQTIPMSLRMEPENDSTFSYQIQYGLEEEGIRDYKLLVLDRKAGQFAIDEQNSITLPAQLNGNILSSRFDVMNNLITSHLILEEDQILYQINVSQSTESDTTGGVKYKGEDIPLVVTYTVDTWQRAVLRKIEASSNLRKIE